jgi:pimeloyl-ACP methyl ester carboxylesterase
VVSADGTGISYYVAGRQDGPTLIAVHGYPDNHAVWDALTDELGSRFRVVSYDVRGTGASDQPTERAAYRVDRLVDDLVAVVDAVADGRPVHLIGHDWGSV